MQRHVGSCPFHVWEGPLPETIMNYQKLKEEFHSLRAQQAASFGKPMTKTDDLVSEVIFQAVTSAMTNVAAGGGQYYMQAVSLGTGMGKTTSACALIAAGARVDAEFTAAFVVPTARIGEEVQGYIEDLLGEGSTLLWSSYHDRASRVDRDRQVQALGHVPNRLVEKHQLRSSRIVIVTHEKLKNEVKYSRDDGVVKYLGRDRDAVFIDESPTVLETYECTATDIQALHDLLVSGRECGAVLPLLSKTVQCMSVIMQADEGSYLAAEVISKEGALELDKLLPEDLWKLTDDSVSSEERKKQIRNISNVIEFLRAASCGNAYYSKIDKTFFSYRLHLSKIYSGYVLLDATSDIEGLVILDNGINALKVPTIDYQKLGLFSISVPRRFRRDIKSLLKKRDSVEEYVQFMRDTVYANTGPGDQVLIVAQKTLFDQNLLMAAEDPARPSDWDGRIVGTQHWGAGVGSNHFRHKTHVFLFGDYLLPRSATIARAHAWSGSRITNEQLEMAVSRRELGMRYSPKGIYAACHEGFRLRWIKQLAMRGTARRIDADGKAMPMKLFTTMEHELFTSTYERIFPGARCPSIAVKAESIHHDKPTGRGGLVEYLAESKCAYLSASEISGALGIATHRLAREYDSRKNILKQMGWEIKVAKELGKSGRERYLVNLDKTFELISKDVIAKIH